MRHPQARHLEIIEALLIARHQGEGRPSCAEFLTERPTKSTGGAEQQDRRSV
jgi:hypothetical protein